MLGAHRLRNTPAALSTEPTQIVGLEIIIYVDKIFIKKINTKSYIAYDFMDNLLFIGQVKQKFPQQKGSLMAYKKITDHRIVLHNVLGMVW